MYIVTSPFARSCSRRDPDEFTTVSGDTSPVVGPQSAVRVPVAVSVDAAVYDAEPGDMLCAG